MKKEKTINNELALLKIANAERMALYCLCNTYFFLQEIYDTIGLIENEVVDKSLLVGKNYELFAIPFDREYSEYIALLKETNIRYNTLRERKEKRINKREIIKAIILNAPLSKSFINRVLEKRKLLNRVIPAKVLLYKKTIHILKDTLIRSNRYLAVNIAQTLGVKDGLEDVINTGIQGLIKAINMFDATRNLKFSTYAFYWIQVFVREGSLSESGSIKIPVYLQKKKHQLNRIYSMFLSEYNRQPTQEELADLLGVNNKTLKELSRIKKISMDSIYRPVGSSRKNQLSDLIEDDRGEDTAIQSVHVGLSQLDGIEANVIVDLYGINNRPVLTSEEICKKYKLTHKNVAKIKREALEKLKKLLS